MGLAAADAGGALRAHVPGDVAGRGPGHRDRGLGRVAAEGLGDLPDQRRYLEAGALLRRQQVRKKG